MTPAMSSFQPFEIPKLARDMGYDFDDYGTLSFWNEQRERDRFVASLTYYPAPVQPENFVIEANIAAADGKTVIASAYLFSDEQGTMYGQSIFGDPVEPEDFLRMWRRNVRGKSPDFMAFC